MRKILSFSLAIVFLCIGTVTADPVGNNLGALQGVIDDITIAPVDGDSSVDVTTDFVVEDATWTIDGSGGSVATMIIELASFAPNNVFGIYQGDQYVTLFNGANDAGDQAVLSIQGDGSVFVNLVDTGVDFALAAGDDYFGYFLDSSYYANGGVFHSNTALNADGLDHFLAYQGNEIDTIQIGPWAPGTFSSNEYILAFEDLRVNPDWDYTDMVVLVESVRPVPEPATMLLLGLGLLGLGTVGRKKFMK